jgi:hypothetical protein
MKEIIENSVMRGTWIMTDEVQGCQGLSLTTLISSSIILNETCRAMYTLRASRIFDRFQLATFAVHYKSPGGGFRCLKLRFHCSKHPLVRLKPN